MPHEIAFGAFFLYALIRFIPVQGFLAPLPLTYAASLLSMAAMVVWCRRHESRLRCRLRLALYPALAHVAYFTAGQAVSAFHPGKADTLLQSLDSRIVDGNASLRLEPLAHPVLTEILSACYLLYFPCLLLSWIYYFRGGLPTLRRFIVGMFTIYGVGFLGYSLLPAVGPHLDPALATQFHAPLSGGWITQLNTALVLHGSNRVDAFPSLHCAITAFILLFDRVHAPNRLRIWLVPIIGLWIATVYLRYHYLVDVIAGFALAAAAYGMVRQAETASCYELPAPLRESRSRSS